MKEKENSWKWLKIALRVLLWFFVISIIVLVFGFAVSLAVKGISSIIMSLSGIGSIFGDTFDQVKDEPEEDPTTGDRVSSGLFGIFSLF